MGCSTDALTYRTGHLALEPSDLDFGRVLVGAHRQREVRLHNEGLGTLALRWTGPGAPFSAGIPAAIQLRPGEQKTYPVRFTPPAEGEFSGRGRVEIDDGTVVSVSVEGEGYRLACDDGNPCTEDTLDLERERCTYRNIEGPCEDGSACTEDDRCAEGQCLGRAISCDDGLSCTSDRCDPTLGCVFDPDPGVCNDENFCTVDVCAGEGCISTPVVDGIPCPGEAPDCQAMVCLGGACVAHPVLDGVACDDGDVCTLGDLCIEGVCRGAERSCDDGDPCTDDACSAGVGCVSIEHDRPVLRDTLFSRGGRTVEFPGGLIIKVNDGAINQYRYDGAITFLGQWERDYRPLLFAARVGDDLLVLLDDLRPLEFPYRASVFRVAEGTVTPLSDISLPWLGSGSERCFQDYIRYVIGAKHTLYLVCGYSSRLYAWGIGDGSVPSDTARYLGLEAPRHLDFYWDLLAYTTAGYVESAELLVLPPAVYDVADEASPVLVGDLGISEPWAVAANDTHLAVVHHDGDWRLTLFDLMTFAPVGRLGLPEALEYTEMAMSATWLLLGTSNEKYANDPANSHLHRVNLTDPTHPILDATWSKHSVLGLDIGARFTGADRRLRRQPFVVFRRRDGMAHDWWSWLRAPPTHENVPSSIVDLAMETPTPVYFPHLEAFGPLTVTEDGTLRTFDAIGAEPLGGPSLAYDGPYCLVREPDPSTHSAHRLVSGPMPYRKRFLNPWSDAPASDPRIGRHYMVDPSGTCAASGDLRFALPLSSSAIRDGAWVYDVILRWDVGRPRDIELVIFPMPSSGAAPVDPVSTLPLWTLPSSSHEARFPNFEAVVIDSRLVLKFKWEWFVVSVADPHAPTLLRWYTASSFSGGPMLAAGDKVCEGGIPWRLPTTYPYIHRLTGGFDGDLLFYFDGEIAGARSPRITLLEFYNVLGPWNNVVTSVSAPVAPRHSVRWGDTLYVGGESSVVALDLSCARHHFSGSH